MSERATAREHRVVVKTVPVRAGLARWGHVLESVLQRLQDLPFTVRLEETPDVHREEVSDLDDAARVADAHAEQVRALSTDPSVAAIAMGCLLEPGLDACRELAVPVTGEIERSVRWLSERGERVGFVTSSQGAAEGIHRRLATHGLDELVVAVRAVDAAPLAFTAPDAEQRLLDPMVGAAGELVRAGASAAIGYGSQTLLSEVTARSGLTLWSPVETSIRGTVALLTAEDTG